MEKATLQPQLISPSVHGTANIDFVAQIDTPSTQQPAQLSPTSATTTQIAKHDEEAQRQACFENAIKEKLQIPNSYVQVAPLIIRWDPEIDEHHVGHTEEIRDLKKVFNRLGFSKSTEVRLHTKDDAVPQHTLNAAITTHIQHNDGPNKLLIIYYTGHGILDKDRVLMLASKSRFGERAATAYWYKAESYLLDPDSMKADVLAILDCCYAGNAQKGVQESRRRYDLLAACAARKTTSAAGKSSFSRRLIEVLNEMLDREPDQRILTTRLLAAINKDRRFPAMLYDRLHKDDSDQRHVQLVRINTETKRKTKDDVKLFNEVPKEKARVTLQFSLFEEQIADSRIEKWAEELIESCWTANVPLRRIDWVKLEKSISGERFQDVVKKAKQKSVRSRQRFRKAIQTVIQNNRKAVFGSRKRSLSSASVSSPSKRRSLGDLLTTEANGCAGPRTPESNGCPE